MQLNIDVSYYLNAQWAKNALKVHRNGPSKWLVNVSIITCTSTRPHSEHHSAPVMSNRLRLGMGFLTCEYEHKINTVKIRISLSS